MELTGTIKVIGQTQTVGQNNTPKRSFVIMFKDGNMDKLLELQLIKDRTSVLDQYKLEDEVKVQFNIESREWQGKYFTNATCWKIERIGSQAEPSYQAPAQEYNREASGGNTPDPLPF